MADDHEPYLAVLKALYDYEPQSDDEIEIKEDQILLLVKMVDEDWWKVKVKDGGEGEAPVGLVPAAYVEQAEHSSTVKAIYSYDAAAPGELSVKEDEVLLVFESEEDWLLVQSEKDERAGFVPANYVEVYDAGAEAVAPVAAPIVIPDSPPLPASTYVDPAERVAAAKVTADDMKTWPVSEIDKKGKKKKGTLGIGNGQLFFASESDKTPVQRWETKDVVEIVSEKSKQVRIDVGGANSTTLHFHTGSKDNADSIIARIGSSKAIASAAADSKHSTSPITRSLPPPLESTRELPKKASVHFSSADPVIIPVAADAESESEEEIQATVAVALYDFTADGDDELSVKEGEVLTILEKDGDEWWKCRNSKGKSGVVPASYLEESAAAVAPHDEPEEAEEDDTAAQAEAEAAAAAQAAKAAAEKARREKEKAEKEKKEKDRKMAEQLATQQKAREEAIAVQTERIKKEKDVASPSPPREKRSSSSKSSTELTRPSPDKVRTWHDRSGQFRVDAEFLGFKDGKLRLHKINGVIVEVPSEKMSHEDMRYVERALAKSSSARSSKGPVVSDDDLPLAISKAVSSSKPTAPQKKAPKIDWFDFFLAAGCDLDDCTRYAAAFERDKIDETILGDITDSTMRSLGLREGDIIRVKKHIESRKPTDNFAKPSAFTQQQIERDEELAKQLQAQESQGRGAAPNLFAGPKGALKQRRGRPQASKSLPPPSVDIQAISSASDQIQRTASPLTTTSPRPTSAGSNPAPAAPPRPPSTPAVSGFDDDAWTNRPSSTKPTPSPAPPAAKPTPTPTTTTSAPAAAPTPAAVPTIATSPPPAPAAPTLAKTDSDIFDQLARLAALKTSSPAVQPTPPPVAAPTPPGFRAGMGMGPSPVSMGQFAATPSLSPPPVQPYNGPRGPFAPVPANASLLQPLIPTQTGFSGFVPTHATGAPPPMPPYQPPQMSPPPMVPMRTGLPMQSMQQTGFQVPMQTGFQPNTQSGFMGTSNGMLGAPGSGFGQIGPLMSQPTGSYGNFGPSPSPVSPFGNGSTFIPLQSQPTGYNNGMSNGSYGMNGNGGMNPLFNVQPAQPAPPVPANNTAPANIFAQMKSGTFAMDS